MNVRFTVAFHKQDEAYLHFHTEHGVMHLPVPLMPPPAPGTTFLCSLEPTARVPADVSARKAALNRLIGGASIQQE